MDYKNFLFRGLVSLIFIFIYLLIYTTNANYLLIFVALIYLLVSIEIINHFKKKIISITYIFSSHFNRYSFEKVDDQYGGQCLIKIDNFKGLTCSVTDNYDCRYMYLICEESKNSSKKNILGKSD